MMDEHTTQRIHDPQSEAVDVFKDRKFGYLHASGRQIKLTNDGLGAERMDPTRVPDNGVVFGAQRLKGRAEFEVKIVAHNTGWFGKSIQFGVIRCKKGVSIDHESGPQSIYNKSQRVVWVDHQLYNNIATPSGKPSEYGYINLSDLRVEDCIGLCLSKDGLLEFTVNGEGQGIAAKKVYSRNSDIYAVVDHYGSCVATVVTKAGELPLSLNLISQPLTTV